MSFAKAGVILVCFTELGLSAHQSFMLIRIAIVVDFGVKAILLLTSEIALAEA